MRSRSDRFTYCVYNMANVIVNTYVRMRVHARAHAYVRVHAMARILNSLLSISALLKHVVYVT